MISDGFGVVELLVKVSAVLALAALVAALMRPASAAARHWVWVIALGGVVALPLVAPVAPRIDVAFARAHTGVFQPSPLVSGGAAGEPARDAIDRRATPGAFEAGGPRRGAPIDPRVALAWIWAAGTLFFVVRRLLGQLGVARVVKRAQNTDLAGERGRVRVLYSGAVTAPVTWGWLRPVILLPVEAAGWPLVRRSAALAHEMAHVARLDGLAQWIAQAACALFWFHPLVWWAARRRHAESEQACDDRAISGGMAAREYAQHLLEVARGARQLRSFAGAVLGMARPSHLEQRFHALLDESRARGRMSRAARAASTAAAAAMLLALAGSSTRAVSAPEFTSRSAERTFDRNVNAAPGERLELDLDTGAVVEILGSDVSRVSVRVLLGGRDWDETEVEVDRDARGPRVVMRQRREHGTSTSHGLQIRVPRRFDVFVDSSGGDVRIEDVEGRFEGSTGGGEITLRNLRGIAKLTTGGGDVEVADSHLEGKVTTGGGRVQVLRVTGPFKAHSGSGPVIIDREGEGAREGEPIQIQRAGGEVVLDEAPRGAIIHTGGGKIRVGEARGTVEAVTGGGDIELGPVEGSVKATTGAGEVHVRIDALRGERQVIDLSSGSGPITIELPRNFNATFDLQTAYTQTHGSRTTIHSNLPFTLEETKTWDTAYGTPRRYVRARQVVGTGGNEVRVRTVNGDIRILTTR